MKNNKIQVKIDLKDTDYLHYTIIDKRKESDDVENVEISIEWTANVEEIVNGVQLSVYSIDKVNFSYDLIRWTEEKDEIIESVKEEITDTNTLGWTITTSVSKSNEEASLIFDDITIDFENQSIEIQFN